MCTVSWLHDDAGYHLLCNRDEKRSRALAAPPSIRTRRNTRYLAPADGDFGGTWIATNEYGISLCLLNHTGRTSATPRSRGLLLPELIEAFSAMEAAEHCSALDLTCYAPFRLIALEPHMPAVLLEWDGVEALVLPYAEPLMPLTSSSFATEAVIHHRQQQFQRLVHREGRIDPSLLYRFHEDHGVHPDAFSTCMHRPDAETVSFSWVRVTTSEAEFLYSPAAPCQFAPAEHLILDLKQ